MLSLFKFCVASASLTLVYLLAFPDRAYASIDPGTGSCMVPLLVAGFLGAVFSVKLFREKIKWSLKRLIPVGKQEQDQGKDG